MDSQLLKIDQEKHPKVSSKLKGQIWAPKILFKIKTQLDEFFYVTFY